MFWTLEIPFKTGFPVLALRFRKLNFDNIKVPYYTLLAKEVVIFRFRTISKILKKEPVS
jgi:hypothetical protein